MIIKMESILFHMKTNASCYPFQSKQQRFSLSWYICKKRQIICVVYIIISFIWIASGSMPPTYPHIYILYVREFYRTIIYALITLSSMCMSVCMSVCMCVSEQMLKNGLKIEKSKLFRKIKKSNLLKVKNLNYPKKLILHQAKRIAVILLVFLFIRIF